MTRNSYRSSLIHGTHNAEVEIVNEDGHWLVGLEIDFSVTPGYEGSHSYHAASDADYYGEGPELNDVEDVRVEYVHDMAADEEVELDDWMVPVVAAEAADLVDDDDLIESLPSDDDCDDYADVMYDSMKDERYEEECGW